MYNDTKDLYFKSMLFFFPQLFIHFKVSAELQRTVQLFSTLIMVKMWIKGIRMISEGSCETGEMMLKIQLCHHRNKLHLKIYSNRGKQLF